MKLSDYIEKLTEELNENGDKVICFRYCHYHHGGGPGLSDTGGGWSTSPLPSRFKADHKDDRICIIYG